MKRLSFYCNYCTIIYLALTQILSREWPGKVNLKFVERHNLKLRNKSSLNQLNMSLKSFKLCIKVLNHTRKYY